MIAALAQVSLRQCRTHRLRVAMTALGIALGVAAFFAISTANRALLDSLALTVERLAGKSTLEVTAGETGFPETLLETVRATPGVQLAEPVIEVIVHTTYADEGSLLILGVDETGDQQLRQYEFDRSQTVIDDPLMYLAQPNSILLSRVFATRHGLRIGDELPLFTANGKRNFVVQGFFQPQGMGSVFGGNIAVMDIYSAQSVFGRGRNFDRIDLSNDPAVGVDELQRRLRAKLPRGVEIERPQTRGQALENAVTAMRLGMSMTSFIALLVGIYIILNSFTIAVDQRWKEIGVLRSLGVARISIQFMFLGEALAIGLVGSCAGVAAGYAMAAAASRVMGSIAASVYGTVSTSVEPHFDLRRACTAVALGVAASLLGAWLPARSAARLDPIQALRNIETRRRETAFNWRRPALGLALIAACFALIELSPSRVGATLQLYYVALILVGMTVLLPVIVRGGARLIRPLMARAGGPEGALAVDAMIQAPRRSSATIGALMVGLMFVYSTAAYIQSYKQTIDRWTGRMLNADLFVATSTLLRSTSYHFSESMGRSIAALPEVKDVQNVRFTFIPYRGDITAVISIEMKGFLGRAAGAVEGGNRKQVLDLLPRGQGLLVSRNFAARWRCRVGQHLQLESPHGTLDLPVVGIVEDYRSDKGSVFMDRAVYKQYWNDDAVDFVDITLQPGQDAAAVKRKIQALTAGSEHALVYTNAEFRRWIGSLVDSFFLLNYLQLAVAVLVAVVGIANTLIVSVAERRREFAIVRAVGGYRSQVRKMVLLEAVAISVVGVLAGGVAALCNIQYLSRTVSTVLAGYEIPFIYPWAMVAASIPIVSVVALIAAWIPARRAMRLEVVEAIGYE